jgi:co-chaperonin GroES (HSP10)
MKAKNATISTVVLSVISVFGSQLSPACFASTPGQAQDAGQPAIARSIGAIKAISGNAITLAPDSGPEITVTVQPNARLLRIAPGEKDLKNATPVQMQELQVGDRVRVRGQASAEAKSIAALEVIVISHSDIEARHEKERQDWQKRGLGGLVSAVDPATGTVTISVTSLGGKKEIAVHTSKSTVFRRYAPDSVKFDDAKPSILSDVQAGDQLRARGDRSADGSELTAEEVVTGAFRNIAGTVNLVDASTGTITVQDLLSKKTVQVKITSESQLHKLPPEMAQRIAMRLKSAMPPGTPGAAVSSGNGPVPVAGNGQQSGAPAGGTTPGGGPMSGGMRQGGAPDFQQMLSRMPAVTLDDLHKGDAVLIVTTQGTATGAGTAITLLSGVEPILQAAPTGSQAMMLAPWSLGGAPGADASQ